MSPTRREFIRSAGRGAIALGAYNVVAHDMVAELLAQTPPGRPQESRFRGLADIALGEAKLGGCSYADIRFTMDSSLPGGSARFGQGGGGR